uniref:Uncharacterized protein n=1 Tax=Tetradesmus obliquus TaxID=3088 RepID=A0A383WF86_TETOB|eukprot:jgi/Sobl393_1/7113/SZX75729.1
MDMKRVLIVALVAALLVGHCSAIPRSFSTVNTAAKPDKPGNPKGNTPSDHFKRLETFTKSAATRNLLSSLQAVLALGQINTPIADVNTNNRKMLQFQA